MKKIILLITLLNIFLFASDYTLGDSLYFKDETSKLTFNQIIQKKFKNEKSENFGFGNFSVWKKFTLTNNLNTKIELHAINYRTILDYVDVYIVHNKKVIKNYMLGDMRDVNNKSHETRFLLFPININKNDKVEVFIKHRNQRGIVETNWHIKSPKELSSIVYFDALVFGSYIGITFLLAIQAFILFLAVRNIFLLYYGLMAISVIIAQTMFNGILHSFNLGIPLEWINHPIIFYNFLLLFTILFHYDFFDVKYENKWTRRYIKLLFLIMVFFIIFLVVYLLILENNISLKIARLYILSNWIVIISLIVTAIRMSLKGIVGGWFYVLAQSIAFLSSFFLTIFVISSGEAAPNWSFYSVILGSFINIIFLSLALHTRLKSEHDKSLKKSEVLIELSKFHNSEMIVNNIIHQWKVPLSRIVSILTNLEAQIYFKKPLDKVIIEYLPEIKKNTNSLVEIVQEFYKFSKNSEKTTFSFKEELDEVLKMLSEKIKNNNASINYDCKIESDILTEDIFAISNISSIIINNFLDVVELKNIKNIKEAKLKIVLSKRNNLYIISFEDNCGGVKVLPFEKVFEAFESSDKKNASRGIGLYIAQTLVEEKLKGQLKGYNINDGAKFEISF